MGKTAPDTAKYVIVAELKLSGIVEKSDIVGAIFGQTEGLLGEQLDLRELRQTGRVGRMEVELDTVDGSSRAEVRIPCSMDSTETALLGAALETVEQIGPSHADIKVKEILDVRHSKRDYIVKRAKQLLEDIERDTPTKKQLDEELKSELRKKEITEYRGFTAGPDVEWSDEVIIVEGEADVKNLLKHGVKNCLAVGGTSVPKRIAEITSEKDATVFLDGDRGGDLILKEMKEKAEPLYVARALEGMEVEELSKKQAHTALRDRSPVKYADEPEVEKDVDQETLDRLGEKLEDLVGTRALNVLDQDFEPVQKAPVTDFDALEDGFAVVFDGEIDNHKIEVAESADIEYLAGMKKSDTASSSKLQILSRTELKQEVSQ